jgi:hypothetical protein
MINEKEMSHTGIKASSSLSDAFMEVDDIRSDDDNEKQHRGISVQPDASCSL